MEKINFVNNSEPYLSAENLNQMQDNIENAVNALVESGSNDNGSYIKFADGTMICRGNFECAANSGQKTVTLPVAFIDNTYDIIFTNRYNATGNCIWSTGSRNTTNFDAFPRTNNAIPTVITNAFYIAIGKWK